MMQDQDGGNGRALDWALRIALIAAVLVSMLIHGWPATKKQIDTGDAAQYLAAADHLRRYGVFSETIQTALITPGLGREPGYAALVSLLMRIDPIFRTYDPACLAKPGGCGADWYRAIVLLNGLCIGLTGLLTFLIAGQLGGGRVAQWLAGLHVWANVQAAKSAAYAVSDYVALALVALTIWLAVRAVQRRSVLTWVCTAIGLAALTLVKAVFLYFAVSCFLIAVGIALARRIAPTRLTLIGALFAIVYAAPIGAWMARNAELGGGWTISSGRTATILSTREVFDHLSPAQYAAAFVYWTRGLGDGLAKRLFAEEVWRPFEIDRPDGFYLTGQLRLDPMIESLRQNDALSVREAEARAMRWVVDRIWERPIAYTLATLPLIWRGLWIDEFIVFSLPALVWLTWRSRRQRRLDILTALAPGAFSLVFYALISLNIPRYQLTALPSLAIAFGLGAAAMWTAWQRSRMPAIAPAGRLSRE